MKRFILPAVLSATVCPGLGQMVKGEVLKGIGIVLASGVVAVYVWNIYDAYAHVPRGSKG